MSVGEEVKKKIEKGGIERQKESVLGTPPRIQLQVTEL